MHEQPSQYNGAMDLSEASSQSFTENGAGEKTLWIWRGLIELGTLIGAIRRTNSGVGPRFLFFSSSPSFGRSLFLLNDKLPHFGMVEVEIYNRQNSN